jgi:hypothetical protein
LDLDVGLEVQIQTSKHFEQYANIDGNVDLAAKNYVPTS